eukprot:TRINITY_DN2455_c0_g1_i1.p1 TRINITY_DN2455_c0_g1~~TRINITY_DN2455_c0_g1_i1.p1  ORF type:complete len:114 (-),score=23.57 TRINITY_DN2455_c0_g1_i1:126-467(-)
MKVSNVEDFEWFIIACKKQGVDNVVLKVAGGFAYIFRCLVAEESCIRQHVAGELRFRSMNIDEMTKLDQFEQCVKKSLDSLKDQMKPQSLAFLKRHFEETFGASEAAKERTYF